MQERTERTVLEQLVVINIGLRSFTESLLDQDIEVVQIDWAPPSGGDQEMIDLLERLL